MHHILVLLFLLSGTCNILLTKWMNTLLAECNDGHLRYFQHPMFLTLIMFMGEFLCFLIYKTMFCLLERRGDGSVNMNLITSGERDFKPIKMFPASLLNCVASVLLFTGLYLTFASSFQMIRMSIVIFVGLFSAIHLNTTLIGRHWMAMCTIACGIIIIITTDLRRVLYEQYSLAHESTNAILTGDLLIVCACIFEAAKMVYEEKYIKMINLPTMQAIGWQGLFGIIITGFLAVALNYIPIPIAPFADSSRSVFDDLLDITAQLQSNRWLIAAVVMFVVTTSIHGYSALSIIKFSSTSNLILADSMRCYVVWLVSVLLEWEQFNFVTVIGFLILQMGIINYRQALLWEWYRSVMLRLTRYRYSDMTAAVDPTVAIGGTIQTSSRPADVI